MAWLLTATSVATTSRGIAWLNQFEPADREIARSLLLKLTLVSHSAFERGLIRLIQKEAKQSAKPIALFATREWDPCVAYLAESGEIDAIGGGADIGSEARVVALIRNLSRAEPDKYLNHPSVQQMRNAKCSLLIVVDDFIGSGERTRDFISAIWLNSTIRSWHSRGNLHIRALCYSATDLGRKCVTQLKPKPLVVVERDCPTFFTMALSRASKTAARQLFKKYAVLTPNGSNPYGYDGTCASIVFEHGCPDNCPVIFWAGDRGAFSKWLPLFPRRSVSSSETPAFPESIVGLDASSLLLEVGQKRLANSSALTRRGPLGATILVLLGLVAKGIRRRSALGHATGLAATECSRVLDRCVKWGWLTPTLKLTASGSCEIEYARKLGVQEKLVPPIGEDSYYPQQLRRPANG